MSCLYEECLSEFSDYFACIEPSLEDGSCAEDFDQCEGVIP